MQAARRPKICAAVAGPFCGARFFGFGIGFGFAFGGFPK
jgi:hypothetical protein